MLCDGASCSQECSIFVEIDYYKDEMMRLFTTLDVTIYMYIYFYFSHIKCEDLYSYTHHLGISKSYIIYKPIGMRDWFRFLSLILVT